MSWDRRKSFNKGMVKETTNNFNIGAYKALSLEDSAAKPLEPGDLPGAQADGVLLEWDSAEPCEACDERIQ